MSIAVVSPANPVKTFYIGAVEATSPGAGLLVAPPLAGTIPSGAQVSALTPCPNVEGQLVADWASWLGALRGYLNGLRPSVGLIINESVTLDNLAGAATIAANADMVYDEGAFNGNDANLCRPGGPASFGPMVEKNWLSKATWYISHAIDAIQENATCSTVERARDTVEYAVASYLLTKTDHSYLALCYRGGASGADCEGYFEDYAPQLYWSHGAAKGAMTRAAGGAYVRVFANGIATLNPSVSPVTYNPDKPLHTFDGEEYSAAHPLLLPPVSARILINGALP